MKKKHNMPKGIFKNPKERARKISEAKKGFKHSEKVKRKMSKDRKGKYLGENNPFYGKYHNEKAKQKNREAHLGKKASEETRMRMKKSMLGKNFKNGNTLKNRKIRGSVEFRLWREAVFARDNWTCQKCQQKGIYLHPHHIKNFAEYLELRFAIDNGITFCKKCHMKFHNKYGRKNNTKEQLEEFLCQLI